ncbi:MAG: hypothetical protein JEY91_05470 [Spirochaetaceae bacterium]|nr:hypothetical protein [Spirochaetaceae bacterium]
MVYLFSKVDVNQNIGGKASSLVALKKKGINVPDGLVLTADSFENEKIKSLVKANLMKKIGSLSNGSEGLFAVRSSAEGEDSRTHSFAGEYESLLNISIDKLPDAIEEVFASRNNSRVKAYTENRHIDDRGSMAVIVQKMVNPLYAGVIFSADPVKGRFEKMIGNAVKGLGEDLVSGEKDSLNFTLQRDTGFYEGPEELKKAAGKLFRNLHDIEKIFGKPMDLEWAWDGRKLHILQARPISTLSSIDPVSGGMNDSLTGNMLWTNANVAEAVPDIMTPSTWSVLKVFHDAGPIPFFKIVPAAANIAGRPYMNISYMISLYSVLGKDYRKTGRNEFFGQIPQNMEIPLIPQRKKDIKPRIIKALFTSIPAYKRLQKDIPSYLEENPSLVDIMKKKVREIDDIPGLVRLWEDEIYPHFYLSCKYLRVATLLFGDRLYKLRLKLNDIVEEEVTNDILSNLSGSASSLVSLNLVKGIYSIQKGELKEEEYIRQLGFRGPHEFELSIPDMQEKPSLIKDYLELTANKDPMKLLSDQKVKSTEAWDKLKAEKPKLAKKMFKEFSFISEMADRRERVRAEMIRIIRFLRKFYVKAGDLSGLGDDVFFLPFQELITSLEKEEYDQKSIEQRKEAHEIYKKIPFYPPLIKGPFDPVEWWKDPRKRMDIADSADETLNDERRDLSGQAASGGIVEGLVHIIRDPEEGKNLKSGEILVATTTNVGWTPYFLNAAGILTDVGAPLSHAAIVARELGIPAIVGCGNVTSLLKTGDRIRMNGGDGSIVLLDKKEN